MNMGQFEEEAAAEMKCYELTSASIPHPSAPLRGEEVEESGGKVSLGRREVERCFPFVYLFGFFYFSLSYSVTH